MARRMTKKQRTRQIILRTITVVALAVIGMVVLGVWLFAGRVEVNLNDITHAVLSGSNGEGCVRAEIDVIDEYKEFFDTVEVHFSQETGLTNGDKVEIKYTYDKNIAKTYKLKVKAEDEFIIVKDLPDTKELSMEEMFEGVSIACDGIAPLASVKLKFDGNRFDDIFAYEIVDKKENYDIGDTVTVRAIFDEDKLFDKGYTPAKPTMECFKEYTVEGVDKYLTSADEMTDDMLASLKEEALSLFTDANEYGMRIFCDARLVPVYENKKCTFRWKNPQYLSAYFNSVKEEAVGEEGTHINDVKLCYEATITQANNVSCNCEVVVRFTDIYVKEDGTVELNLESGSIISADRRDNNIKNLVSGSVDNNYETTKL